uniref:Uncharacterized protein n=1 Tax=Eutreptiella gymnastica TaxID=73025 RepID=A0A7S4LCR5_9EUGL
MDVFSTSQVAWFGLVHGCLLRKSRRTVWPGDLMCTQPLDQCPFVTFVVHVLHVWEMCVRRSLQSACCSEPIPCSTRTWLFLPVACERERCDGPTLHSLR